ncbi:2-isopropylmalate synthase [bacterium BMS3Abin07]|nr:2-isopropylmalate synthase [bacterium BMS3Abin07]GBE33266.1 2-isopropylmalate synthase [bacterium BMS3Bbin05]HDL19802.1 citramalate synthase [Nitrospirota bacterium]HDO23103.1 citramalate synthase [Nitrospirota bacterium]HDZ87286.1 citramalate synthase [Nitrospirota bacterium]
MKKLEIYDTTLRDGAQSEDISFSLEDKLKITEKLDEFGIHYIEGGWPGSNPKDVAYFKKVKNLGLHGSKVVAFGSTRRKGQRVEKDTNIKTLLNAGTEAVTIFGKTWDFHVAEALKTSLEENLEMIFDSVRYLKKNVDKVFFDAEHFFDGYRNNPVYAVKCLRTAQDAGADIIVLCDTNGGTLPLDIHNAIRKIKKSVNTPLGIHAHNDSGCGVANTIIAIGAGAVHFQGTINGLGERCGNANICSVIPNLQLKLGYRCISDEEMVKLREVSRFVNEMSNIRHFKRQPFVGDSAFAHKAGIHVSAVRKRPETYEHIRPELVGNSQRVLISDLAGRSNVLRKADEFGIKIEKNSPKLKDIIDTLKELENLGFQFEGAEASFELLMKKALGLHRRFFDLAGFRVIVEKRKEREDPISEATIMVKVKGHVEHTAATGNGPVNALDNALRKALEKFYPELRDVKLLDYKVRVLTAGKGTQARVRVLVESGDKDFRWGTVGVSENIIEASWQALVDSIEYKLLKEKG